MILITDKKFKRSFKRLVKKNPQLQDKIKVDKVRDYFLNHVHV